MVIIAAWILIVLGLGHTTVGGVLFKKPLADAVCAGFVGQFEHYPDRRAAFWFMIFGPLLIMGDTSRFMPSKLRTRGSLKSSAFICLRSRPWEALQCHSRLFG